MTSPAEVKHLISILDISKANGPDLLSAKCGGTISKIFNLSFETGKVPQV